MVLTSPLLEAKVHVPRPRASLVARPRLSQRLDRITESKLTLISAPAGFGKSTLLAGWLATPRDDGQIAAWLSIDQADDEAALFWSYLISALRTAVPGIGETSLSLLESPQSRIDGVLAPLLNELSAVPNDVVLVLDDFHLIHAPDIQEGIAYLVDHLPGPMHLVIATRADPALPLARLRARGELIEIRAADLRFTPGEASAYLNDVMGLDLGARDVAALEGRTEGWIAALQLAGLSMQGRDDVAGFIAGFAGDDRYIVDYLVEEVLHRQTDGVRSFLLQTSILARMSGPLCDAITRRDGGRATLEALDRANLFVVSLDDRREWYRYHHLFADVLQARLLDERPDEVAELHRRASEWYDQNGESGEAIRHAMASDDFERAAALIELAMPGARRDRQDAVLRQWLEWLPDELIRARPVLSNGYAAALLVRGEPDGVERRLQDAERWLSPTTGDPAFVDEDAFRDLPGSIAIHRAGLAQLLADSGATVRHARRALQLLRDDDHLGRGSAFALLGLAQWANADLDAAYRDYADALASLHKAGYLPDVVACAITLADIRVTQGRLSEAKALYERGLRIATTSGDRVLRGAADMHVGVAAILIERNELDGARRHLLVGSQLGEGHGLPRYPYRSRVAMAQLRLAEGDLDAALGLLIDADRLYFTDFAPSLRPVPALIARAWIAAGRLSEGWGWAHEHGLSAVDQPGYVREFEYATLARLLLAQGVRDRNADLVRDAQHLLDRLLSAASAGGRWGSVIDFLLPKALSEHAAGDSNAALATLERGIGLAEPEGYIRAFVDEGPPMAALLKLAVRQRIARDYASTLLTAFGTRPSESSVDQPLVEPLSERELEVLRLLESELDGPGIARELFVSLNTVRTHTKNIYAKLGVSSRRAAVRRAAELGLLARAGGNRPPP